MKAETTRSPGVRELEFQDSIVLPSTLVFIVCVAPTMAMLTSSVFSSFGAPTRTRAAKCDSQAMQTLQSLNQHFRLTLNAYILNNWVHSHAESLVSNVRARFLGRRKNPASSPRETQQKTPSPLQAGREHNAGMGRTFGCSDVSNSVSAPGHTKTPKSTSGHRGHPQLLSDLPQNVYRSPHGHQQPKTEGQKTQNRRE